MQTPDDNAGTMTERVMAALVRADVLKADEPNYPTHYNRAYSAVYEALKAGAAMTQAAYSVSFDPPVQTFNRPPWWPKSKP